MVTTKGYVFTKKFITFLLFDLSKVILVVTQLREKFDRCSTELLKIHINRNFPIEISFKNIYTINICFCYWYISLLSFTMLCTLESVLIVFVFQKIKNITHRFPSLVFWNVRNYQVWQPSFDRCLKEGYKWFSVISREL